MDKKRAELHLHTYLSDDVSFIGVEEVFQEAEGLGLTAVAFTNLNNVQDFPKIMRYAKKRESIKVIYGAELRYKQKLQLFRSCDIIGKTNIGHRRRSAVALNCRIRCPSELGLLCVQ